MIYQNVYDLIKGEEENYKLSIPITDSWMWNMYEHIRITLLYKNSKYTHGRDEPFKNIVRPILNLAYRAEGFDVKDIVLFINDKYKYFKSFLVKKFHEKWVRENNIDTFIDEMVESYVDFGGALIKDVNEKRPEVVPLQRIAFCDQTDILSGPICEKHYFSPDQLKKMEKKKWENIDEILVLSMKETDTKTTNLNQKAKTPGKYIEIYEIHGMFPRFWLYDKDAGGNYTGKYYDDDSLDMEYVRQLHICCFYQNEAGRQGITLYKGLEKELPYKLLLRDKIYGRALGLGGAEELFEPQVWTNYAVIHMKNMLDAASKIIFQTADKTYANRNKIQDMENLEVTIVEENKRIEQIDTQPRNIVSFENSVKEWWEQARTMGSAQEAIMGDQPPAGTPFKSVEFQAIEGHSIHEYRKGKIAIFLDEIYQDWIIPHISSEITNGDEFLSELDLEELQQVADAIVLCETNTMLKQKILNGESIGPQDIEIHKNMVREEFMKGGNKRFITILDGEMKDAPLSIEVNIVGKQKNLIGQVDKLTNIFRTIIANPAILQNPPMAKLFNEILESSGLSPVDFSGFTAQTPSPAEAAPRTTLNAIPGATPGVTGQRPQLTQANGKY